MFTNSEPPKITLIADSLLMYQPRYANPERTRIRAIVRLKDDRFIEMEADVADPRSPLIRDVFCQYSKEEIEWFTAREAEALKKKSEIDRIATEDKLRDEERQVTFQAKTKALEMTEVQNCRDKRIKQKIRKANSALEVAAWVSLALGLSLESESGD